MLWGSWWDHPKLLGRFHADFPDDLQVTVHDGGPRLTANRPELVWVRMTGAEGDLFRGRVLNQPHHLQSVRQGDEIHFIVPEGCEHPIQVTEKYLGERPGWEIRPCNKCGLPELFDAPSDLIRVVFPNLREGGVMQMFTAFCPLCGGIQVVKSMKAPSEDGTAEAPAPGPAAQKKHWWQFWNWLA
jgi:hypothetical protein